MPPDQNQDQAPDPLSPPSQPVPPATQQPGQAQAESTTGGMKVVQPLAGNTTAVSTASPPTDTAAPAIVTPPVVDPSISQPAATYQAQTQPLSRSDFEKEANKGRKRKLYIILMACVLVIVLGGAGGFYYWYSSQDHSIFSKLNAENYDQGGLAVSFSYPALLHQQGNNPIFTYGAGSDQAVEIAVSTLPKPSSFGLKLTPSQFITQIKTKSGSYVDALNNAKASFFGTFFNGCNTTLTTTSGHEALLCISSYIPGYTANLPNITDARVIEPTNNFIYELNLIMQNPLWNAHPHVWQKVEKSFSGN